MWYNLVIKSQGEISMKKGYITRQKNLFSITSKNIPKDAEVRSHQLMIKSGFVSPLAAGIYQYTPLGLNVLKQIENIIREEMNEIGTQEILLPALQPAELWEKTGRINDYGSELVQLKDRHDRAFVLGPTHEEIITNLAKQIVSSHKNLPISVYQIQTKYRDEKRPRYGLLRGREFLMKDAYSFHETWESLDETYQSMYQAYKTILSRLELDFRVVEADGGAIGGEGETHEFMVLSDIGEDDIVLCDSCDFAANTEVLRDKSIEDCPKCGQNSLKTQKGIEVGHIFKLGTKYSNALAAEFLNKEQKQEKYIMGCFGIGISRLLAAFVEQHNDDKGIIWTKEVKPYDVHLITIHSKDEDQKQKAEEIAKDLKNFGYNVLYDDRDKNTGIKFTDAELIGIPIQIIIGKNGIDMKYRKTMEMIKELTMEEIKEKLDKFYR